MPSDVLFPQDPKVGESEETNINALPILKLSASMALAGALNWGFLCQSFANVSKPRKIYFKAG